MRLWSLHPSILDQKGLVAVWREGLLAQKVLQGQTKGYVNHPQLIRFRGSERPLAAISTYLWGVQAEATSRGYNFDSSKILEPIEEVSISVTQGQIDYEYAHLQRKVMSRSPEWVLSNVIVHPIFVVVEGDVESWEKV